MSTATMPPPLPEMSIAHMPPPSPEASSSPIPLPLPDSNTPHNTGDVFQCGHTDIELQSVCGPCGHRVAQVCMPDCCVKLVAAATVELLLNHPARNESFRAMIRQVIMEEAEQDYNARLQAYEAAVAAATESTNTMTNVDLTEDSATDE
ncbi:uncharacterized protein F5147DRAFT_655361 [Suillus discolor]|uniref:Uncharacterized protein n=1 Tax=Suillus discolor TaxID=1912936 RepID=A0A9P7F2B8_9AGAM|nr:uncharacterized protein F5147DRAFT_655361 [Suillus discolor]KAG2101389.1 hypothetical protein F5147DRAFT_655361 [Suillus discolor]